MEGGRGVAPGSRFTLNAGSGPLHVRHGPQAADVAVQARLVAKIGYHEFDRCPICLTGAPDTKEHVPQYGLGGQVRTRTCGDCNNRLGSRVESELADWCFGVVRHAQATGDSVVGRRRISKVLFRRTDAGVPVWVVDRSDPAVRDMLRAGRMDFSYNLPSPNVRLIAALKHAYLAACLHLRQVPVGVEADEVRRDLLAARDAESPEAMPVSEHAARLSLMRSYVPPSGPSLALGVLDGQPEAAAKAGGWWVSLAGVLFVSWPLLDTPPTVAGQV